MSDDRNMETPQISRSGRVLKKSAKVKEMEDFDINELDVQGKSRKKSKTVDDFDDYEDKRVAPIKIPKISLNMQGTKKKIGDVTPGGGGKQLFKNTFQNSMKVKQDIRRSIYHDSSDGSKESDSSSVSSESSSTSPSSSEASDEEIFTPEYRNERKVPLASALQSLSVHQDKVIVEQHQQYESPSAYMEQSSGVSSDDSEDAASDSALVIAEDSDESSYTSKGQKSNVKKRSGKKDPSYASRPPPPPPPPPAAAAAARRKPVAKNIDISAKKKKPVAKAKAPSAYMLWCTENKKKNATTPGNIGIGKKMGETWQALPEKEKLAWKRKAKRIALKNSGNLINTGPNNGVPNKASNRNTGNLSDELLKGLTESTGTLGTAPIDAAAHMKLLGDSLTVIGQRLIEHEGQLAVSGIYSVLLDTLLCAIAPLLCLTSEITGLDNVPPEVFRKTLDHIAYFMPGL